MTRTVRDSWLCDRFMTSHDRDRTAKQDFFEYAPIYGVLAFTATERPYTSIEGMPFRNYIDLGDSNHHSNDLPLLIDYPGPGRRLQFWTSTGPATRWTPGFTGPRANGPDSSANEAQGRRLRAFAGTKD